jgi:hypothetical protein
MDKLVNFKTILYSFQKSLTNFQCMKSKYPVGGCNVFYIIKVVSVWLQALCKPLCNFSIVQLSLPYFCLLRDVLLSQTIGDLFGHMFCKGFG